MYDEIEKKIEEENKKHTEEIQGEYDRHSEEIGRLNVMMEELRQGNELTEEELKREAIVDQQMEEIYQTLEKQKQEEQYLEEPVSEEITNGQSPLEDQSDEERLNQFGQIRDENVYFVPEEQPTEEKLEQIERIESDDNVYFVPEETEKEEPKKKSFIRKFVDFLLGKDEPKEEEDFESEESILDETNEEEPIFTPEEVAQALETDEESKEETIEPDEEPKEETVEEPEKEESGQSYQGLIIYAKSIRTAKKDLEELEKDYDDALKTKDPLEIGKAESRYKSSQKRIHVAESMLKTKIESIKNSDIPEEEKKKVVARLCGIAKMKLRGKKAHLEKEIDEDIKAPEEEEPAKKI